VGAGQGVAYIGEKRGGGPFVEKKGKGGAAREQNANLLGRTTVLERNAPTGERGREGVKNLKR